LLILALTNERFNINRLADSVSRAQSQQHGHRYRAVDSETRLVLVQLAIACKRRRYPSLQMKSAHADLTSPCNAAAILSCRHYRIEKNKKIVREEVFDERYRL
jgi:hypothetical protein